MQVRVRRGDAQLANECEGLPVEPPHGHRISVSASPEGERRTANRSEAGALAIYIQDEAASDQQEQSH